MKEVISNNYEKIIVSLTETIVSHIDGVVFVGDYKKGLFKNKRICGIVVDYQGNLLNLDISICISKNAVVKEVSFNIQQAVKNEIERSTNFRVSRINVNIIDVR